MSPNGKNLISLFIIFLHFSIIYQDFGVETFFPVVKLSNKYENYMLRVNIYFYVSDDGMWYVQILDTCQV